MLLSDDQIRYTFLAYKDIESPPKGEYLQVRQHRAIAKAQLQAVVDDLPTKVEMISHTISGYRCGCLPCFDGCGYCKWLSRDFDKCKQHDELAGMILEKIIKSYEQELK